ncbi:hypothetical protein ZWY2020_057247 [Hordeum vulgare]|nr:hypothetical protein ZWY2020_057247 [Hordeum vulgare]
MPSHPWETPSPESAAPAGPSGAKSCRRHVAPVALPFDPAYDEGLGHSLCYMRPDKLPQAHCCYSYSIAPTTGTCWFPTPRRRPRRPPRSVPSRGPPSLSMSPHRSPPPRSSCCPMTPPPPRRSRAPSLPRTGRATPTATKGGSPCATPSHPSAADDQIDPAQPTILARGSKRVDSPKLSRADAGSGTDPSFIARN